MATYLYTGMRKSEALALTWRAVDFQRREIVVEAVTAKTSRCRVIPMAPALDRHLRALRKARKVSAVDRSDPVFTLADGHPITPDIADRLLSEARDRCKGIPAEKKPKVNFYCLRHNAELGITGTHSPA